MTSDEERPQTWPHNSAEDGEQIEQSVSCTAKKEHLEQLDDFLSMVDHCLPSLLCTAVKLNNANIARYFLSKYPADVNRKLSLILKEGGTVGTILCLAANDGIADMCRILIENGADIDERDEIFLRTPLSHACASGHTEVVRFLIDNGAQLEVADGQGKTSLILAVDYERVTRYLIRQGANVNATDYKGRTALHYAALNNRLGTTKLLLNNGAYHDIRDCNRDDALIEACKAANGEVAEYFLNRISYDPQMVLDAYDLLGASLHLKGDSGKGKSFWRKGIVYRKKQQIHKQLSVLEVAVEEGLLEFRTKGHVEEMRAKETRLQALMVYERVLGEWHPEYIMALLQTRLTPNCCILALEKSLRINTLISSAVTTVLANLMQLRFNEDPQIDVVIRFLETYLSHASGEIQLQRPLLPDHEANYLNNIVGLLYIVTLGDKAEKNDEQNERFLSAVQNLIKTNLRCVLDRYKGYTLLHFAADPSIRNVTAFSRITIFPQLAAVMLLLECGADPKAVDEMGLRPMDISAIGASVESREVTEILECVTLSAKDSNNNVPRYQSNRIQCFRN